MRWWVVRVALRGLTPPAQMSRVGELTGTRLSRGALALGAHLEYGAPSEYVKGKGKGC